MLHIAVCDDEPKIVEEVEHVILDYALKNDIGFIVYKYHDGEALLNANQKFDLIFLDIEMEIINGIETAQRIRSTDMNVPIVYITSYTDYWRRAYKVHAFEFISKPFEYSEIYNVLQDILILIQGSEVRTISLITEDGMVVQNINEICYFIIKEKKTVQVSTVYREYIAKENLADIFAKLDSNQFYLTYKSCIVNLKYVENIKKKDGIIMKDGTWLPLAQKKQKDFFYCLSKQLRNEK